MPRKYREQWAPRGSKVRARQEEHSLTLVKGSN